MARYRFTDVHERVFTDLVHGDQVTAVKRKDKEAGDPSDGSTLILRPGDEVTLAQPIVHALLEPVDAEAKAHAKAAADAQTAEQPAEDTHSPADTEAPVAPAAPQE